jgi:hypothetical protein
MTSFRMSMLFSLQKTTRSVAILRAAWVIRRGLRPWHVRKLFVREPGNLTVGQQLRNVCCSGPRREGEEP